MGRRLAIVEFEDGARVAPLVVLWSGFLAALESDPSSPMQLKRAKASNSAGDSCPDASNQ